MRHFGGTGRKEIVVLGGGHYGGAGQDPSKSQNSGGRQKTITAGSGWKDLVSSPASASVSGDSLTRNVRQLYHPKPLAQQSEANTVGRGLEGTR